MFTSTFLVRDLGTGHHRAYNIPMFVTWLLFALVAVGVAATIWFGVELWRGKPERFGHPSVPAQVV